MSTAPAVSTLPFWGQAWELTITYATASGDSTQSTISCVDWSTEGLRLTFDVLQAMNSSPFWYADINIYNLNDAAVQTTLLNATWVTLKAGFQTGLSKYATIWDGPVFQALYTREEVVDQCVTLHCIANPFVMDAIVNFAAGPFSSQAQLIARMASEISLPPLSYGAGTVGPAAATRLAAVQYPRGNTVFGKVSRYLTQIADSNFLQTFHDGQQAYISEVDTGKRTADLVYSPPFPPGYTATMLGLPTSTTQSIIGTPRQLPQGAIFTVLLDPRLKVQLPPLLIRLARTQIAQTTQTPSPAGGNAPTALNANLMFFVSQVRHTGDTRGNLWQTEVTGFSTAYAETLFNFINVDQ